MKKLLSISFLASAMMLAFAGPVLAAMDGEDLLVNDDRVFSLSNKYAAMISSMYEDETAYIGLPGYHYNLSLHDAQSETYKLKSLEAFSDTLNNIDPSSLSAYAKADLYTLKELVGLKLFNAKVKKQYEMDPLWYLEPIYGVYRILFKNDLPLHERLSYAVKRLEMVPDVLKTAEQNITNPPDLALRLAIEQAKLENKHFSNITALINKLAEDNITKSQIKKIAPEVQKALTSYEKFLQGKLKEKEYADFRIGEENYKYLYQNVYSVPFKFSKLESTLHKNLQKAQDALIEYITPTVLASLSEEEKIKRTVKKKVQVYPGDYYLLEKKYRNAPEYDNVLKTYSSDVKKADAFFTQKQIFPPLTLPIKITTAPPILRGGYSQVSIFPPVPLAEEQNADVLVTMPKKLDYNKAKFDQDYNYGKIKFNAAEFITPGESLIYSVEPANISLLHKLSDDIFYIHGWISYALNTANENGFFTKDEDKLNILWYNYTKAVYAMTDYLLQIQALDYTSSLAYINKAGIKKEEAEPYLDYLALHPFDAVSYIIGEQEFVRLRAKYKKKLGKDFDLLDFHTKILSIGRVPLFSMAESLERTYTKKNVQSYFNMTYF